MSELVQLSPVFLDYPLCTLPSEFRSSPVAHKIHRPVRSVPLPLSLSLPSPSYFPPPSSFPPFSSFRPHVSLSLPLRINLSLFTFLSIAHHNFLLFIPLCVPKRTNLNLPPYSHHRYKFPPSLFPFPPDRYFPTDRVLYMSRVLLADSQRDDLIMVDCRNWIDLLCDLYDSVL